MSESNSTETSPIMNAPECDVEDEPELHILTQQKAKEQAINHKAPLTKQLNNTTRLIQGMTITQHPTSYPRACRIDSFSTAGYQPDTAEST